MCDGCGNYCLCLHAEASLEPCSIVEAEVVAGMRARRLDLSTELVGVPDTAAVVTAGSIRCVGLPRLPRRVYSKAEGWNCFESSWICSLSVLADSISQAAAPATAADSEALFSLQIVSCLAQQNELHLGSVPNSACENGQFQVCLETHAFLSLGAGLGRAEVYMSFGSRSAVSRCLAVGEDWYWTPGVRMRLSR